MSELRELDLDVVVVGAGFAGLLHRLWSPTASPHLKSSGLAEIEASPEAEDTWVEHVNDLANQTPYPTAASWYMGANTPGKPRVFMPYVGGVGTYRAHCEQVAASGYSGFRLSDRTALAR